MKFDYPEYRVEPSPAAPEKTSVYRPVIRVRMTGSNASRAIWALLDTGADESYITESIAERLGVTPVSDARGMINSASGEMRAWYGNVSLEVTDGEERHVLPVTVGVVPQDWSEIILGHLGFFEHFDATFSDTDKIVTLSRRSRS
jgi:predicted aspartyl protease